MNGDTSAESEGGYASLTVDGTNRFSVVLEDDGRVAYAYLFDHALGSDEHGEIVSDVWLYNVVESPPEPEWETVGIERAPFLNPPQFCAEGVAIPVVADDGTYRCELEGDDVSVLANGEVVARLRAGTAPGWSIGATADSPVARPLSGIRHGGSGTCAG